MSDLAPVDDFLAAGRRLAAAGLMVEVDVITLTGFIDWLAARRATVADARTELERFVPLSDGLLLELEVAPEKIGHVLIPESSRSRKGHDTWFGRVLAIGPGFVEPKTGAFRPLQVRYGDRVCFPAFLGHDVKLDGQLYRLVYERDVCAREPAAWEPTFCEPCGHAAPAVAEAVADEEPLNSGHVESQGGFRFASPHDDAPVTWEPAEGEVDGGVRPEE